MKLKNLFKSVSFYRRLLIGIMMLLIVIRPTFSGSTEPSEKQLSNLNVWFVVDATGSMVGKDVAGGTKRRFELVQDDIKEIVEALPGAKYGMIAQDVSTYLAAPMTTSADAIFAATGYARPKYSLYSNPTDLSELLTFAADSISKYRGRHPERTNVLVYMGDGEDVSNNAITIPEELSRLVDATVVFGYGSSAGTTIEEIGGYIKDEDDFDISAIMEDHWVTYYYNNSNVEVDSNHRVISKLNETNLKTIASGLNATYYHRDSVSVPSEAIATLSKASKPISATTTSTTSTATETYWIFAIILLFLLLWEGEEIFAHVLSERNQK